MNFTVKYICTDTICNLFLVFSIFICIRKINLFFLVTTHKRTAVPKCRTSLRGHTVNTVAQNRHTNQAGPEHADSRRPIINPN